MVDEIEITGRDRYLIAEALLMAAAELRKRHRGHSVDAADMEKLLWSFFTRDELHYFGLIDRPSIPVLKGSPLTYVHRVLGSDRMPQ